MNACPRRRWGAGLVFGIGLFMVAAPGYAAVTYAWVPDRASGGSGTIIFDEGFIAANEDGINYLYTDPGNFITAFNSSAVTEISFTFASGYQIEQTFNFSTTSTIQNGLSSTPFQVLNGELRGFAGGSWSFEYNSNPNLLVTTYSGASVDQIFCVVPPCPQRGAHFTFTGPQAAEVSGGVFRLVVAPGLAGDYNADGSVDQADLDFVLLNWGDNVDSTGVPSGWINDLPTGLIGQSELDGVLLNWGNTPEAIGSSVPEPALLTSLLALPAWLRHRRPNLAPRDRAGRDRISCRG